MRRALLLLFAASATSCATLAGGGGGDRDLPSAEAGPFRKITAAELGNLRSAPNALEDDETLPRDAAAIDADGDPATLETFAYVAATLVPRGDKAPVSAPPNAIVRYAAIDGRSFDRAPITALEPSRPWEGGTVGAPAVIRAGGETLLFYGAAGGIGLARSADGETFTPGTDPVLAPEPDGWEAGAVPSSPGVARLEDGSFRLFYEIGTGAEASAIGEARSADLVTWTRLGAGPVLAPSTAGAASGAGYDDASVGGPFPLTATSAEGRPLLLLYYAARDHEGQAVIGLAARPGDGGAFTRATSPVFGTSDTLGAREPSVVVHDAFTLLFATQRTGRGAGQDHPAVAAGVAPAQVTLPPPEPK